MPARGNAADSLTPSETGFGPTVRSGAGTSSAVVPKATSSRRT